MILGLVSAGGGGVEHRLRLEVAVPAARRGWRLAITLTPTAARWLEAAGEVARLRSLTDLPVRWESRLPDEPKPYPMPDAFLFVPATANSVAKLAVGISDNQAMTALNEAVGTPGVPVVVRPQANPAQRAHPRWEAHLETLLSYGVHIADGPSDDPWEPLLDLIEAL
ncbi:MULTISPECIES: flavoprotein [Actinokineospora]|uniref:Flavoprotein n=1 Tax=Actinokineospora fastidiosa TaxID=1816 RepID=A0A918GTN1_9PSEU|nr:MULTISPECIES: flavoprotein [Actinokineospora]UVS78310.1 bifunctional phosphopantothenoylcysteine decarboxylase/phosphopantothenate synthase [Actinokineospora sp. UTMC 2448]GGS60749.1 flavoprotein [Actinokineospora fastidiosa]